MRTLFLSFYKHQKAVRNVMIDTNKQITRKIVKNY